MSDSSQSGGERAAPPGRSRFGTDAPRFFRGIAVLAWCSLLFRVLSTALPGSRSGIEALIRRTDALSSLVAQLMVLLGATELVLLVVTTLPERSLGYVYRIVIVPAAASTLMLVMLASTMGLEPQANIALGISCIALAAAAASASMRDTTTRAQGFVLLSAVLCAVARLSSRLLSAEMGPEDPALLHGVTLLSSAARTFDTFAVAIVAARLIAEKRLRAGLVIAAALALSFVLGLGAVRGSFDGASPFQILASRALAEVAAGPAVTATITNRYAVETFAVILSGVIAFWPGRVSLGLLSAALVILARPSVDVPASALVLSIGALAAPLSASIRPKGGATDEPSRLLRVEGPELHDTASDGATPPT